MTQTEIIKIIKTKDNWDSNDLIKTIESQARKEVKFCHISGYESLTSGTKTNICKSLKDIQNLLNMYEIDYDKTITDPIKLAKSIENEWIEMHDDGGGSGWIEFK